MIPPFTAPTDGSLAGQVRINVTAEVLQWLSGERLNRGFCFTGSDESMAEDSNDSCINHFRSFKLELTYLTFAAAHAASASIKPRAQPSTYARRVRHDRRASTRCGSGAVAVLSRAEAPAGDSVI
jgi:hypothetical protein